MRGPYFFLDPCEPSFWMIFFSYLDSLWGHCLLTFRNKTTNTDILRPQVSRLLLNRSSHLHVIDHLIRGESRSYKHSMVWQFALLAPRARTAPFSSFCSRKSWLEVWPAGKWSWVSVLPGASLRRGKVRLCQAQGRNQSRVYIGAKPEEHSWSFCSALFLSGPSALV